MRRTVVSVLCLSVILVYHDHIGVLSAWHEILNLDISAFVLTTDSICQYNHNNIEVVNIKVSEL